MALYLGKERLGVTIPVGSGIKYVTGTITSDEHGIITFPELDFTPTVIAVWNMTQRDLKAEAEEEGNDWDDSYTRYVYDGVLLLAVYHNNQWFSQVAGSTSGQSVISNASYNYYDGDSAISVDENMYSYAINKFNVNGICELGDMEFNYAIYG